MSRPRSGFRMTLAIAAFATPVEATRSHHGDFQMISMGLGRHCMA